VNALLFVRCCWLELGIYWLLTSRKSKENAVNEKSGIRVFRHAILALVLILLLTDWQWSGILRHRFIPEYRALAWVGAALTFTGVQLAIWARYKLGGNWSDKVVLKVDHELIQTRPYRYLRHPIYTGGGGGDGAYCWTMARDRRTRFVDCQLFCEGGEGREDSRV
jgi:protein-S-isoprenylcysteine O-methyltransferase Ste14